MVFHLDVPKALRCALIPALATVGRCQGSWDVGLHRLGWIKPYVHTGIVIKHQFGWPDFCSINSTMTIKMSDPGMYCFFLMIMTTTMVIIMIISWTWKRIRQVVSPSQCQAFLWPNLIIFSIIVGYKISRKKKPRNLGPFHHQLEVGAVGMVTCHRQRQESSCAG